MSTIQQSLTDHLDIWASAELPAKTGGRGRAASNGKSPHGIQKLRELVLDLTVRGKLVPQDTNDEPASVLLENVRAEKAAMVKEGKVKKDKDFPDIAGNEIQFDLPVGWKWARINDVGHDWGQKTPHANFTYIDVSAIDNTAGVISTPSVLSASDAPSRARKIVKGGTVIYSTVRPYLKNICVIEEEYSPEPIASTAFAVLHPLQNMPGRFFALYLRSPEFVKYVESVQTGIAYPAINDKQFYGGLVPVPPLAEQHRIVAKVDELMALCDRLEQEQADNSNAHQTLVETLLATLTISPVRPELRACRAVEAHAPSAPSTSVRAELVEAHVLTVHPSTGSGRTEFAEAWTRIAKHFDTLFTTEQSIDQLKQTILQLAVMGKLVPQDPNDEPASELLKKIAAEKSRLIKEKKIKKQEPLPEISDDERPFEIPTGWVWCRLGETGIGATGKTPSTKEERFFGGDIPFIGPGQITPAGELLSSDKSLTEDGIQQSAEALPNDILMVCIGGSIGKSVINDKRIAYNQQINAIRPIFVNSVFLNTALSTDIFYKSVLNSATGSATPIINRSKWEELLVPIAPEEEQLRIVAKVDELMAICDALKARLNEAQITQVQLADAIVEQAVA